MDGYCVFPLIAVYLLLPFYTALGGWRRTGDRPQIRLLWFLLLPLAAFCTLWYCSRGIWTVFWFFLAGEAYWEQYGNGTAAVVAMIVSAILLVRMATGRVTRRYLQINSWGVAAIAGLFCAVLVEHFVDGIDGWTARGAAENRFANLMEGSKFYPAHLPRRIVDETTPFISAHNGKAVALYVGDARAAEIHVMPYYRWWWTVSYSRNFPYGKGELGIREQFQRFRESLKD